MKKLAISRSGKANRGAILTGGSIPSYDQVGNDQWALLHIQRLRSCQWLALPFNHDN
jgi:hypothetical protein